MKFVFRKILVLFLFLAIGIPAFSEIPINLYGKVELPVGDYAQYISTNLGAGVGAELEVGFVPNLGVSIHADFTGGVPKDTKIQSLLNMAFYGGIWYRLCWGDFIFQPELNYGVYVHRIKMAPGWKGPEEINVDQMLQIVPAFRWIPGYEDVGKMGLDVAPYYTMIFEQSNVIHQVGLKLGLVYLLD